MAITMAAIRLQAFITTLRTKYRRKLRMRLYDNGQVITGDTPVFLEIKQRVDRVTQKRRALMSYRDALTLSNDRQIPDHDPQDQAVIEEIDAFIWQYNLRPTSIVRYDRQALIGSNYEPGLRVTFDTLLSVQAHPLHLNERNSGMPMLPGNYVVMEIKVNDRIPHWLVSLIAAHNLQMTRVSKYCRGIEAAWDLPGFRQGNLIAESSREILSMLPSIYASKESRIEVDRKNI